MKIPTIEKIKEPAQVKKVKIKIEILPYVAPYSEYGWIRMKFMDFASRASKNDIFHKVRKDDDGFYYIEKITVIE